MELKNWLKFLSSLFHQLTKKSTGQYILPIIYVRLLFKESFQNMILRFGIQCSMLTCHVDAEAFSTR